jgi:hypothetical protein
VSLQALQASGTAPVPNAPYYFPNLLVNTGLEGSVGYDWMRPGNDWLRVSSQISHTLINGNINGTLRVTTPVPMAGGGGIGTPGAGYVIIHSPIYLWPW